MIKFLLTLAIIGGLLGLIFSNRGDESGGFFRGAKSGAKLGCFLYLLLIALIVIAVVFVAMSA